MASNEAEVHFTLIGNGFDPDEVTRAVGLEPTSIKREGALRREPSPLPKCSSWRVSSGKVEGDVIDVGDLAMAVVSRLVPYLERLAEVKRRFDLRAELAVVLWISTDDSRPTPAIGFEPAVIAFLNALGAGLDIDTYRN